MLMTQTSVQIGNGTARSTRGKKTIGKAKSGARGALRTVAASRGDSFRSSLREKGGGSRPERRFVRPAIGRLKAQGVKLRGSD